MKKKITISAELNAENKIVFTCPNCDKQYLCKFIDVDDKNIKFVLYDLTGKEVGSVYIGKAMREDK